MKKLICILLSCFMMIGLVGCGSNKSEDTDSAKSNEKDSEVLEIDYVKFGEIGKTDKWEIKVIGVTEPTEVEGNSKYDESISTNEKFIVVQLEMKNISEKAISYSGRDFGISTEKAVYDVDDVGFKVMQKLNQKETIYNKNTAFVGVYDDINPGMSKNTYIAFNVPKDVDINSAALGVIGEEVIYMYLK